MKSIYIVVVTAMLALLAVYFLSPWPVALGTVAAWVTTGSFFLQVLHIVRNRDTKALSLGMWSALFFGVSCWTWYGYRVHDVPVMTANGLTALLAFSVILLKLYHERPGKNRLRRKLRAMPGVILRPRIRRLHPYTPGETPMTGSTDLPEKATVIPLKKIRKKKRQSA